MAEMLRAAVRMRCIIIELTPTIGQELLLSRCCCFTFSQDELLMRGASDFDLDREGWSLCVSKEWF